jgi:hypothetical protein
MLRSLSGARDVVDKELPLFFGSGPRTPEEAVLGAVKLLEALFSPGPADAAISDQDQELVRHIRTTETFARLQRLEDAPTATLLFRAFLALALPLAYHSMCGIDTLNDLDARPDLNHLVARARIQLATMACSGCSAGAEGCCAACKEEA